MLHLALCSFSPLHCTACKQLPCCMHSVSTNTRFHTQDSDALRVMNYNENPWTSAGLDWYPYRDIQVEFRQRNSDGTASVAILREPGKAQKGMHKRACALLFCCMLSVQRTTVQRTKPCRWAFPLAATATAATTTTTTTATATATATAATITAAAAVVTAAVSAKAAFLRHPYTAGGSGGLPSGLQTLHMAGLQGV